MLWTVISRWGAMGVLGAAAGCSSSSAQPASGGAPDSAPTCLIDASIATFTFPDAALGDAGSTSATCGSCLNSMCASWVQACDKDCLCLETTKAVLECGQDGGTAYTCAEMYGSSDTNFISLAGCILESCKDPCALNGVDAGSASSGDAADDAPEVTSPPDATVSDGGPPSDAASTSDATGE